MLTTSYPKLFSLGISIFTASIVVGYKSCINTMHPSQACFKTELYTFVLSFTNQSFGSMFHNIIGKLVDLTVSL